MCESGDRVSYLKLKLIKYIVVDYGESSVGYVLVDIESLDRKERR
jgi:hypothetical protein